MHFVRKTVAALGVLLILAALALPVTARGNEILLGVIAATPASAKNQTNTSSTFTIPQGAHIVVDCVDDSGNAANAYMAFYSSTSTAVTSSTYTRMASFWETYNGQSAQYLSILGVTTNVNCHVSTAYP